MPLGELRPSPLVQQAADEIRTGIAAGEWAVGAKLPGETTLAAQLGVGRSTVREALRVLAAQGLVRARQGAGVFVLAATPPEDWPTRLRKAAVADVYEVRMLVEVQAARLAAERRGDEDLAAIRAALDARRMAAAGGGEPFIAADIDFHAAVVAAAHNPVLTDLFAEFAPALRRGLAALLHLVDAQAHEAGHGADAHEALARAVADGDPGEAARVLAAELAETLQALRGRAEPPA